MLEITLYTFGKRENSTARPSGGVSFQARIWDGVGIMSPQIIFSFQDNTTNPTAYNYAHIPAFNRYYFIRDWQYKNRCWIASMQVDTLASWRDYIADSTQYVTRSAADYDGSIMDSLYPATADITHVSQSASDMGGEQPGGNPFVSDLTQGTYIVGIINASGAGMGAATYYALSNGQFGALRNALMGNTDWLGGDAIEITQELLKTLFNPFQYIASCIWVPFSVGGSGTTIKYGWWDLGVSGSLLTTTTRLASAFFSSIPKHPQSGRGEYLNLAPFSRYVLNWPVFGTYPLDPAKLQGCSSIDCQCFVDLVSGKGTLNIIPNNGSVIASVNVQVGVPITLAQMATDYAGSVASFAGAIGEALTMDFVGAVNGIGNTAQKMMPQLSTGGSNGSVSPFMFPPALYADFLTVVDDSPQHRGRPLCSERRVGNLAGYMTISDPDIDFPCTADEQTQIKQYMESGFYYE